jgi:flavin prenyltransferase
MKTKNVVLAITGASGAVYAVRLLEVLIAAGYDVYLSISPSAQLVLKQELNLTVDLDGFSLQSLQLNADDASDSKLAMVRSMAGISSEESSVLAFELGQPGQVHYYRYDDLMAPIASGSFLTTGMVICPCSGSTLGAVVHGSGDSLIHRAASVHLKERRKLILVPRETPLSTIQLDNMKRASEVGAVVLPAMPGFYHGVTSIRDLVDFVVARICDQLGVVNSLVHRWGT